MAQNVKLWGPLWAWSTFSFEDGNGYLKKITHGSNKIDMEIANTLKIYTLYRTLKFKLFIHEEKNVEPVSLGACHKELDENEREFINKFCTRNKFNFNLQIYARVNISNTVLTSQIYNRQKFRKNRFIYWNNTLFGEILYFISARNVNIDF